MPAQWPHPPFVLGGHGEQLTLSVVAQQADIWNTVAETVGRDPTTIEWSVQVFADLDQPAATRDLMEAFIGAGASHIVVEIRPLFPPGIVRRVAEVMSSRRRGVLTRGVVTCFRT